MKPFFTQGRIAARTGLAAMLVPAIWAGLLLQTGAARGATLSPSLSDCQPDCADPALKPFSASDPFEDSATSAPPEASDDTFLNFLDFFKQSEDGRNLLQDTILPPMDITPAPDLDR